jgi:diguanylate cyclase (GGDEF)-like protein
VKRLISGPWHGLRVFALITGLAAVCTAAAVLAVGWGLGVSALRGPMPRFATMKPNTAIGVGVLGLGLLLSQSGGAVRRLHLSLAALAVVLGALTLAEYGFGWDAGIDQLMFIDTGTPALPFPGRPAPLTAVLLVLLGVGQLSPEARGWRHAKAACTLAALLIAWALLNGYLFGRSGEPGTLLFGSVAVHTAGSLFVIALGTLATQPGSWPVRTVFADNLGGTICRWLLPMAVLAPSILGWLLSSPTTLATPETAFNWALYAVSSSAGSVGLILILARRIEILDAERTAATMMSLRDALTGLANRRAFDTVLLESFSRARRYGRQLSLLTLDIDHFKSYNDTFGHPAGDEVLQAVSGVLAHVARESDLVARIGGEEFAIVLSETGAAGAHALAERIRAGVAALKLQRAVTISVGVASLSAAIPTAAALLKESDTALYAAKKAGRDCVAVGGKRLLRQAH